MPPHSSLSAKHSDLVLLVLQEHIPHVTVWMFGSRALGTAKEYSDLDLAIVHTEPLDSTILAKLRLAFEESDLPFKVDIVELISVSEQFKEIIESSKVEIQSGTATGI